MTVMRRTHGFTLIEIMVVMAIIAVLAAIAFPVYSSMRNRAHLTACEANLYQMGRVPEGDSASNRVSSCPYPQGDDDGSYIDVSGNYKNNDPNYTPDAGTVQMFCVEHLAKGTDTHFEVPLRGKFPVLKFGAAATIVDAKGVTRWKKIGKEWTQIDETGDIPVYPEIWHFPGDDFPQ
jgi:prepilin-type N-terminal cleavage/methylation domain-containing protein